MSSNTFKSELLNKCLADCDCNNDERLIFKKILESIKTGSAHGLKDSEIIDDVKAIVAESIKKE